MIESFAPYLPGFIAAYAILLVAALSPGPAVALLLGIGMTQGRAAALITTAGIASGSILLNILTLTGIGLIVSQAAWAMTVLRWIGAAYLIWLAYGACRKAAVPPPPLAVTEAPRQSVLRLFGIGFALQATNPKAVVFWIAINAVGATAGAGAGVLAVYIVGAFVISFACHGAWALALSSSPARLGYAKARRYVEGALGAFFTFAAFKLAVERS